MVMKTQGTSLYMVKTVGGTSSIVKIGCPTSISYGGSAADQIETTCLDASDSRTYIQGLKSPGTANFGIDFDTANASHMDVYAQYNLGGEEGVTEWAIGFSDGTGAPTLNGSGKIQGPSTRSWLIFEGYVSNLPFDFAINSVVKADVPIQVSGQLTVQKKA